MAYEYDLIINGYGKNHPTNPIPTPAEGGIKVTDEPVWDPDAGRDLTGTMIATLVCWKRTVNITWNALTADQVSHILNAVGVGSSSAPFFDISYNDINLTNKGIDSHGRVTINVYVSNIPRTIQTLKFLDTDKSRRFKDVTLTFIER